jgi:hypothetical protein
MLRLSKDILVKIALNLNLKDGILLSLTCKKIKKYIYDNKYYWVHKFDQDITYPEPISYIRVSPNGLGDPREYYKFFHTREDKGNDALLYDAAKMGDLGLVSYFLRTHDVSNHEIEWVVGAALSHDNVEVTKHLIDNLKPLDKIDIIYGSLAGNYDYLYWIMENAASTGHLEIIKYIREKNKNIYDIDGKSLTSAAKHGHLHIVKYLIENDITEEYHSALNTASCCGLIDMVKYLSDKVDYIDLFRARSISERYRNTDIVEYINTLLKT